MIDLEQRLGSHVSRYLTNGCVNLSCPPGTVGRDLRLDEETREVLRGWLQNIRSGAVFGGSGRGLLITGLTPYRNVVAGAMATTAVLAGLSTFAALPISAVPIRTVSTTAYLETVKASYDDSDQESADLVRAMKGGFSGYFGRVLNTHLLVLTDLGQEPRASVSDFPREELRALLSLRFERHLPTIVTTPKASGDLQTTYKEDFMEVVDLALDGVEVGEGT